MQRSPVQQEERAGGWCTLGWVGGGTLGRVGGGPVPHHPGTPPRPPAPPCQHRHPGAGAGGRAELSRLGAGAGGRAELPAARRATNSETGVFPRRGEGPTVKRVSMTDRLPITAQRVPVHVLPEDSSSREEGVVDGQGSLLPARKALSTGRVVFFLETG